MSKNTNLSFLTDYITADITNGRIGINNASPTVAFDVSGATKISGALTLTSTISNGTYTYTLPSATGTLALTSALSSYLQLTGGTLTGALSGTSATFSGTVTVQNPSTWATVEIKGSSSVQGGQVDFYGSTTRYASITGEYESSTNGALLFRTLKVGTLTTALTITSTGAATFSSNVTIGSTLSNSLSVGLTQPTTDTLNQIFAGQGAFGAQASGGETDIGNNWYYYSGFKYRITAPSSNIKLNGDVISFERAVSGSANAAISFAESMRITSGGNVGIGTTTPGVKLEVNGGGAAVAMTIATSGATTAGCLWDGGGAPSFHAWSRPDDCGIGSNNFAGKSILIKTGMTYGSFTTGTTRIEIQSSGAVVIPGSLSKGSGSFRIDHPLKPNTHQLVHSFIEGPQADLIYRGKLTLVNGKAQANIDEVSTMTEGTFEALCREVQCFTTNENGWDLVKGKVIGNIIYIESQNPNSTDEISWMVIGERKDKHMMDTEWTDEQGKVIVEPLKQK